MTFSIFIELYNHNHNTILEYFPHSKKKPYAHLQSLPKSSS